MDRAAAVEKFKEVSFVWLLPLNAVRRERPDVKSLDVVANHHILRPSFVFGKGTHDKSFADTIKHFRLWHLDYTREGKHELGIGQRMVFVVAGNEGRTEIGLPVSFDLTISVTMRGGNIASARLFKKVL